MLSLISTVFSGGWSRPAWGTVGQYAVTGLLSSELVFLLGGAVTDASWRRSQAIV